MKNEKTYLIIILSVLVLALIFSSVIKEDINLEFNQFMMGEKIYTLNSGDILSSSSYKENTKYNYESFKDYVTLYNGVTIGTKFDKVVKLFDIKSGYAKLNMEVPNIEHDGTTNIVNEIFEDIDSVRSDFLDCYIIFGYKNNEGVWEMVEYSYIEDADIIFGIDIDGFSASNHKKCQVSEINIEYVVK